MTAAMPAGRRRASGLGWVSNVLRIRELGVALAFVITIVFFSLRSDDFLTPSNWREIASSAAIVAVVAVGETTVILTRNIDLSIGSTVALSAYVSATLAAADKSLPPVVVFASAVVVGAVCGLVNGVAVTVLRVPAIVATLATLAIFRGVLIQLSGGVAVNSYQLPQPLLDLATSQALGVPLLDWMAGIVVVIGAVALRWTRWGRNFYAVGSNPSAALLAGIRGRRVVFQAFAMSGALAGVGGFFFVARYGGVDSSAGLGFEFDVVTAVVIGGVNVFGGAGSVLGAVLGAVLVTTITNGFVILKVSSFWLTLLSGIAIVVVITIDAVVTRRLQEVMRRRRAEDVQQTRRDSDTTKELQA